MRRISTSLFVSSLTAGLVAATSAIATGTPAQGSDLACVIMSGDHESAAHRVSPLDSVSFEIGGGEVKICYGRPSARGRTIFGSDIVPFNQVWRTGANEPTMIHTSVPLTIGDIEVQPGTYSLYTVPGESEWQIIVNAAVDQWGRENYYTEEVEAQELGRYTVPAETTDEHVETFTIRAVPGAMDDVSLVLEWVRARVTVPVSAAG